MLKNKVIVLSNILEIEIFELDKREIMEDGYKFAGVINKDGELLENFEGSGNFATPSCVEIYLLEYIYRNKLVTITKDNIHLYYEFMSDEDKNIYHNLIWTLLVERYKFIIKTLSLCDFQVGVGFFKVKDTLKPIDEYIEEIKESSKYKEYIKNKQ